MRITKNNICTAIKKETGYDVKIQTGIGNGYFYFYSDDKETDLMLSSLETTSIYSNLLTHQSIEKWVTDFKSMLNGTIYH